MDGHKPSILVFTEYYTPAYKAGGPIRSIEGIVHHLHDIFNFYVITSDRDVNDESSFEDIEVDSWNDVNNARVFYCSPKTANLVSISRLANSINCDLIYENNFFGYNFGIKPLFLWRLGLLGDVPLVFATRGVFYPNVLEISKYKKKAYISIFKTLNMHKQITFHASTKKEEKYIQEFMGSDINTAVAGNLPLIKNETEEKNKKQNNTLRVVFLSRISEKKNLDFALKVLSQLDIKIAFNIYGPVDNRKYWRRCQGLIESTGEEVSVSYEGAVSHDNVGKIFSNHDIFFFPTKGENYGHAIFEALSSGCPPLISDQTPWSVVAEKKGGWVIPLDKKDKYVQVIREYANLSRRNRKEWEKRAVRIAKKELKNSDAIVNTREMFESEIDKC